MWRCNAGRNGSSNETLPDECHLMWTRELPRISPAFQNKRLQFDAGYEPVVVGKTLLVGSPRDDSLTALHTETGKQMWRFRTDGPVRFAPVARQDRVFLGQTTATSTACARARGSSSGNTGRYRPTEKSWATAA